jgi:hypothetical protein
LAKRLEVDQDGQLVLSVDNNTLKVDGATGLVKEYQRGDYETRKHREVLQFGANEYGDLVVPAWRFDGEYVKKRLHRFTLRILDEMDFTGVADDQFAVIAEPGSVVVDGRGDTRTIRRIKELSLDATTIELDRGTNED